MSDNASQNKVTIDSRGDVCPVPVVKTLKALKGLTGAATIETIVDNEVAVQNLTRMATGKGLAASTKKTGDKEWTVAIAADGAVAAEDDEPVVCEVPAAAPKNVVVQVTSDAMGEGSEELGHKLMKAFFFSLTQLDELPQTILFYNGGAHLTSADSPVLEDLKNLADAGVEILTCGTCTEFYGITDKLAVGEVTNMYVIAQKLTQASVVVRP